jgi:hypothetical protein
MTDVEIERALVAATATLNDQKLEGFDAGRVQEILTQALGEEHKLEVDDGGGVHDETGRVGVIRSTGSGDWITERQNPTAERSHTAVPSQPPQSKVPSLLTKFKVFG